ncbi:flagellar biosynthesis repressor FlbT [Bosea sp. (in: a-proteobacteria)]|uniref:flagellar biosynthesis repressor FlbT n=1 Tax=Bosea sp. (in: a-proteobacteria) TaxID=1871050 RepID=UPI002735D1E8|nr:flagellar biosynthesis repressor FlbT [Bosea sp. (in: a-proteobacteria)]MDP3408112.1 flagellar biosynthesis repressor FlbT [Bosea sp. (in: a-proteobacteria)]
MALHVELRPGEKVYIGRTLVTNGKFKASLYLEGREPILKQKDMIDPAEADTVCKRIYVAITDAYLAENAALHDHECFELVKQVAAVAPSLRTMLAEVSKYVLAGEHYTALKLCKHLIEHEAALIAAVMTEEPAGSGPRH